MTSGFSWEWVSVWSYYLWFLSFWCWKNQLGKGITCVTFFPLFPTHAFLPEYFKVNYRNGSFSLCSALPEGSCTHWSHCCRKGYLWIPQHGRKQLKEQNDSPIEARLRDTWYIVIIQCIQGEWKKREEKHSSLYVSFVLEFGSATFEWGENAVPCRVCWLPLTSAP